jgi:hypothetical protein
VQFARGTLVLAFARIFDPSVSFVGSLKHSKSTKSSQVTNEFRITEQRSDVITFRIYDDLCPEPGAILTYPPTLDLDMIASFSCRQQKGWV